MNVYETCPTFTTEHLTLRLVRREDAGGLLKVYSDEKAQPFFNADNCTSDFRYARLPEMIECVNMWMWSYQNGYFVRWTILHGELPVGTVEMFKRDDGPDGRGCGVLRIDLHSRYERGKVFDELLPVLLPCCHRDFGCARVLTKAFSGSGERLAALGRHGFVPAPGAVSYHDGTPILDYWVHRA